MAPGKSKKIKQNTVQTADKLSSVKETVSEQTEVTVVADNDLICVGIGASAGGLEALEVFFRNMPVDTGMAFVVVQHLSPDYKSLMGELLSRYTTMKIYRAEDGIKVLPNSVYLIPPKMNMTIFHGKLFLTAQDFNRGLNLPIDIFLRSLAQDKGKNAVAIILSGTGSDGTLGIRSVKEEGGMVMVQDDQSAKFDGMPRSSIATGLVDYILPPEKMPEELVKYIKHPYIKRAGKIENIISKDEDILTKILKILRDKVGVDFTYYKPATILRRLEKRISINQINKIENYISFLEQSSSEARILYKELLIGVTQFFRDQEAFRILEEKVIPGIFEGKKPGDTVRIWSVGCSTGEEAYSLAILLREYMDAKQLNNDVKVFATDIDSESIEYASSGVYPESIVSDVTPDRLRNGFTKRENSYVVSERIRRMVIFASHSVIKDPPFTKIDLIVCRNVLIYLNAEMQKRIMAMFYYALQNSGFLFLGSSETIGELAEGYQPVNSKWKLYRLKEGFRLPAQYNLHNTIGSLRESKSRVKMSEPGVVSESLFRLDGLLDELVSGFIPPSVLVDSKFELLHVFNDVNKFLIIPAGKANLNILKMVQSEVSVVLSSLLHKVAKDGKPITYRDVKFTDSGRINSVDLGCKILNDPRTKSLVFLVSFILDEKKEAPAAMVIDDQLTSHFNDRFHELERELKYTKENLQATIEELETSNEELQSTNEELIASNEELQSTNEELQSVNEELYTVNSEYQNKIEELTQLTNDINNLLKNTNIGTMFLDKYLRIRRYTPAIVNSINLIDLDLGRPFYHISHNLIIDNLREELENVLDTLSPKEIEVQDRSGKWYILRLLPYRTLDNAVDGIVLTLIDITERRRFESSLKTERELLIRSLEINPTGHLILGSDGLITYANKALCMLLDLDISDLIGKHFDTVNWMTFEQNKGAKVLNKMPLNKLLADHQNGYKGSLAYANNEGKEIILALKGVPIYDSNSELTGLIFTFSDITSDCRKNKNKS